MKQLTKWARRRLAHIDPANLSLQYVRSGSHWLKPYFEIEVSRIEYKCGGVSKDQRKAGRLIRHGDWDKKKKSLPLLMRSDPRYLFYKEHLLEGIPIHDTTAYEYHVRRQEACKPRARFTTRQELKIRLEEYVHLFRAIEKERRVTPSFELSGRRGNEIGCCIGRHREVLKLANGNNRFAISLILGLPRIPVQIDIIHSEHLPNIRSAPGMFAPQKVNYFLQQLLSEEASSEARCPARGRDAEGGGADNDRGCAQ